MFRAYRNYAEKQQQLIDIQNHAKELNYAAVNSMIDRVRKFSDRPEYIKAVLAGLAENPNLRDWSMAAHVVGSTLDAELRLEIIKDLCTRYVDADMNNNIHMFIANSNIDDNTLELVKNKIAFEADQLHAGITENYIQLRSNITDPQKLAQELINLCENEKELLRCLLQLLGYKGGLDIHAIQSQRMLEQLVNDLLQSRSVTLHESLANPEVRAWLAGQVGNTIAKYVHDFLDDQELKISYLNRVTGELTRMRDYLNNVGNKWQVKSALNVVVGGWSYGIPDHIDEIRQQLAAMNPSDETSLYTAYKNVSAILANATNTTSAKRHGTTASFYTLASQNLNSISLRESAASQIAAAAISDQQRAAEAANASVASFIGSSASVLSAGAAAAPAHSSVSTVAPLVGPAAQPSLMDLGIPGMQNAALYAAPLPSYASEGYFEGSVLRPITRPETVILRPLSSENVGSAENVSSSDTVAEQAAILASLGSFTSAAIRVAPSTASPATTVEPAVARANVTSTSSACAAPVSTGSLAPQHDVLEETANYLALRDIQLQAAAALAAEERKKQAQAKRADALAAEKALAAQLATEANETVNAKQGTSASAAAQPADYNTDAKIAQLSRLPSVGEYPSVGHYTSPSSVFFPPVPGNAPVAPVAAAAASPKQLANPSSN